MKKQHYDKSYGLKPPENYERFFVPVIGEPLARDLLQRANLRRGERILDVACGTGIVTRLAAAQVGETGSVTGLDINPGMLAVARSVTDTEVPVEWCESGAENMPLQNESFDVVLCQLSLQFMENKPAALKEMHRVLVPDGRIYINVPGNVGELFQVFIEELGNHISAEAAGFAGQVFSLHSDETLRQLMDEAGFHDIQIRAEEKTFRLPPSKEFLWQYVQSTPLAGLVSAAGKDTQQALERDIVKRWKKFGSNGRMTYQQKIITSEGVRA